MLPGGCMLPGGVPGPRGVCSRGCLLWGVSAPEGGVCSWEVSASEGVYLVGGCLLPEGTPPGTPLPCEQNSWHMPMKILPCPKLRLWAVNMTASALSNVHQRWSWSKYYLIRSIVRSSDIIWYVLKLRRIVWHLSLLYDSHEHRDTVCDASVHSGGNQTSENSEHLQLENKNAFQ